MQLSTSAPAERNKLPIGTELERCLPARAQVLEIASGTGQHAVHFAARMPGITWQPSDRTDSDLAQIEARRQLSGLTNIRPALRLDVLDQPWPVSGPFDALLCINMIHISPWEATPALFDGASRVTQAGTGLLVLYGPYREGGHHTAPSNEQFEQWLWSQDSRFGVRNLEDVDEVAYQRGFARERLVRMPANNLLLVFRRL